MVRSAFGLLEMEVEGTPSSEIPSRHQTTLGQDLRWTVSRLAVTTSLLEFAATQDLPLEGKVDAIIHDEAVVYYASHFVRDGAEVWRDASIPNPLRAESFNIDGILIPWPSAASLPTIATDQEFRADLAAEGVPLDENGRVVLLIQGEVLHAFRMYGDSVSKVTIVGPDLAADRLGEDHRSLSERKVAVIGCGSLGSKVAVSLARSGVGNFLLVDDDVLLAGNFVRHDLDWRDIVTHKADGVARRVQLVNPTARTDVRRQRLGGQESSGNLEGLIEVISQCDLIVDATSSAEAFNYLCAAAETGRKAMIWAEIHGGGIGGLIARHRPGIEPGPALMRRVIENWCAEKGIVNERPERSYEDRNAGIPWVADDADVSVIAAHASRFAIDLLIPRSPSIFPRSAYFIGLAEGWLYSEPFHTEPVDVGLASQVVTEQNGLDAAEVAAERARVIEILGRSFGETPSTR
ncbi:Sulfur carrier protein ThiS adenylyltransferase [Aminobacter sp. MSH1]|nr:Sulfur carrier protein ThiS adenylyltransferase [Aminobacter sp. MSH1]